MKKIGIVLLCIMFLFGCVERRQNQDTEPAPTEPAIIPEPVVVNPVVLDKMTVEDGETGDTYTIRYTYNEKGQCTSEISRYENGRVQSVHTYEYTNGYLFSDDYDGMITYYEYNGSGQCITERSVGMYGETETKKEYDEQGFLQKETTMSSGGVMNVTEYTYVTDDAGRIRTKIIKEQDGQTIYRYEYVEKDGLIVQKSTECYTVLGKDEEETLLFTGITDYTYDGEDVIKEVITDTYLGCITHIVKTYIHLQDLKPDNGQYVKVKDVCRENEREWERIYEYDSEGTLKSMTEQDITTTYTFENGLLMTQQNQNETICYQYDSYNRKIQEEISNELGTYTRVYSYNEYGDLVFTSYWDNSNPESLLEEFTYEYHYEGDELMSSDTMVNEMVLYTTYYTYRYDSRGRMITKTAEVWDPVQEEILSTTYYEYAYDIQNQLIDYYELIENGYKIVEFHSIYDAK